MPTSFKAAMYFTEALEQTASTTCNCSIMILHVNQGEPLDLHAPSSSFKLPILN